MHDEEALPMRVAEQRALEVTLRLLQDVPPQQVLATTLGRGQAAHNLAVKWPQATVRLWFLDHYRFSLCQADMNGLAADANAVATFTVGNLQGICAADVPQGEYDLAVLPSSRSEKPSYFATNCKRLMSSWQSVGYW